MQVPQQKHRQANHHQCHHLIKRGLNWIKAARLAKHILFSRSSYFKNEYITQYRLDCVLNLGLCFVFLYIALILVITGDYIGIVHNSSLFFFFFKTKVMLSVSDFCSKSYIEPLLTSWGWFQLSNVEKFSKVSFGVIQFVFCCYTTVKDKVPLEVTWTPSDGLCLLGKSMDVICHYLFFFVFPFFDFPV